MILSAASIKEPQAIKLQSQVRPETAESLSKTFKSKYIYRIDRKVSLST
jgi:hypothetical protein